ncbi:hypothetical protein DEI95_13205 [Curtobacterium sp. MCBD17_008]|nr:hypothetical protein DEI95_13205 [Curtobacterium sp. MCBD17_008]
MPAAGRKLAALIHTDELIYDRDGHLWRVHSVAHEHDEAVLTIRNELGERSIVQVPLDATVPVPVVPTTPEQRALLRAAPWWGLAFVIGFGSWVVAAPLNGGLLFLVVVLWLCGAFALVTPLKVDR